MRSLLVVALSLAGCTSHQAVDALMTTAYRPDSPDAVAAPAGLTLLAGDTHCHVTPPDHPGHVGRGLAETVALAEDEELDFVVLTPHLWDAFGEDPIRRREARMGIGGLRERVAELDTDVVFVTGFEYTSRHGHATFAFADLDAVLAEAPAEDMAERPGAFVEAWVDAGGLVFVNHPLLTPFDAPIANARWNLSWRVWTDQGPWPEDIRAIHRAAVGWEAYNLSIDHLHDKHYFSRPGVTQRSVLAWLDRAAVRERRRMTPVGGSDSHSSHLRATTFVLATDRSVSAIREAFVRGRTCIRSPWPCTLSARGRDGAFQPVGSALSTRGFVDVRLGASGEVFLDGEVVARPATDEVVRIEVPRRCAVLRALSSGGASGPIYLDCDNLDDTATDPNHPGGAG